MSAAAMAADETGEAARKEGRMAGRKEGCNAGSDERTTHSVLFAWTHFATSIAKEKRKQNQQKHAHFEKK